MNMEPANHQPISEENISICTTVVNGSVVGEKQPPPEDVVGPNEGIKDDVGDPSKKVLYNKSTSR